MSWLSDHWQWLSTTAVAGVGAAGVVMGEVRKRRERPVVEWGVRSVASPIPGMGRFGHGEYACTLRNTGDTAAREVQVLGFFCEVHRGLYGPPFPRVIENETVEFSLTPDDEVDIAEAFLVIIATTGPVRQRRYVQTWTPLGAGELADERARQSTMTRWRRLRLPSANRRVAGPGCVASTTGRLTPRSMRRLQRRVQRLQRRTADHSSR